MIQSHHLPFPLTLALLAAPAWADTVSVPASKDNTLVEDAGGATSNGAGVHAYTGTTNSLVDRRFVMAFDLTGAVPSGSTVNSVTLSLRNERIAFGGPSPETQTLHRMTQDWGEGTSNAGAPGPGANSGLGAPSTSGDATWIHTFFNTATWTNPGGDFVATPSGTFNMNSVGLHTVTSPGMTADVQTWIDNPASNYGWLLKDGDEVMGTAIRWSSRESATPADRPTLTIDFTPPASGTLIPFCDPANPNSTSFPTVLTGTFGSGVGSGLHLEATSGPPTQFGYFLVGTAAADPGFPVDSGELCLSITPPNQFGRYNVAGGALNSVGFFDAAGILQNLVGTSTTGTGFDVPSTVPITGTPTITTGQTWHFQLWHRENNGDSNLSNGLTAVF